ncbi:MAG: endo-1,4-beta-xylanase [Fimbriimonas sp.]|nr:endo-1,4-beta-xylanase [Fimbriimonas sp.]
MITICSLLLALSAVGRTPPFAQVGVTPPTRTQPGLRALAKRHHLNIGSAMPVASLRNDIDSGQYSAAAIYTFNMLEPENDFKPPAVWTGPREYRFTEGDFLLGEPGKTGWAQAHGFKVRGHVLVYAQDFGYTLPQWLRKSESSLSKEDASALLHDYIFALAGRYRGKVAMWDVANEAIDDRPNQNPYNLRNSFWFRKLGPEFLVLAFKWAHEADPRAELYYNEYGIEGGGQKAQHLLDLVKWLKEQGAPIKGVGLQYHIDCHTSISPGDGHYKLIDDLQRLRLAYMITELDVAVRLRLPSANTNRDQLPNDPNDIDAQARVYASVFQMALSSRNCHGVQIWGLNDRYSWIPGVSQGRNGLATILDRDYKPKPAYAAIEDLLRK